MTPPTIAPAALTADQAAAYLGISRASVYRLIEARKLPAKRMGASVRIPKGYLDRWLESGAVELPEIEGAP